MCLSSLLKLSLNKEKILVLNFTYSLYFWLCQALRALSPTPAQGILAERISTVDLLVLTGSDQLLFVLRVSFYFLTKQPILTRRSTKLSLPLQLALGCRQVPNRVQYLYQMYRVNSASSAAGFWLLSVNRGDAIHQQTALHLLTRETDHFIIVHYFLIALKWSTLQKERENLIQNVFIRLDPEVQLMKLFGLNLVTLSGRWTLS